MAGSASPRPESVSCPAFVSNCAAAPSTQGPRSFEPPPRDSMTTHKPPRSHARRHRLRSSGAGALVAGIAAVAIMAASATPAGAAVAPAARTDSEATLQPGRIAHDGGGGPGELDVAMLILMVGVGCAIAAPIAGRARLSRERSIRRFRGQLRRVDVVSLCQRPTADPHHQAQDQDPRPPGPRGHDSPR